MIAACLADDCDGTNCACECHDPGHWSQEPATPEDDDD